MNAPDTGPVETELKLVLEDRAALEAVLAELGPERLTVKTKGREDGDFVARGEWEERVTADDARRWTDDGAALVGAVAELLERHGASLPGTLATTTLGVSGSMRNRRRRAALPGFDELVVEADETTYPNGDVRFEIELEVPDAAAAREAVDALAAAFSRADVQWRPSKVSKRERLERVLRGESA